MPVVGRPPQRQKPVILAAAATSIQLNRVLYSCVVPAFGLVLLLLVLRKSFGSGRHSRSAYIFIASLSILSGLLGSLGSHAQIETVIQTLLSIFLCIPVLHLTSVHKTTTRIQNRCQFIIRALLKSLLFISLSSATLLTIHSFLSSKLTAVTYLSFPTTLFLAYTIFALCLLISHLFAEICRANPATLRRKHIIDIHVSERSPVPINLVRSSCFPAPKHREQHRGIREPDNSSIALAENQKRPSVDSGISIISAFTPTKAVGSIQPLCSNTRQETDTLEFKPLTVLQFRTCIQDFLPLFSLLLAELALCASYACKVGFEYKPTSLVLETIHNALNVVGVMTSMKAYLLHAYNVHRGCQGPPTTDSPKYSNGTTPNFASDLRGQHARPCGHIDCPPLPPKSLTLPLSSAVGSLPTEPPRGPECNAGYNPIRAYDRQQLISSSHKLQTIDSDEKEQVKENGLLINSVSIGSLKSAYETGGSEESDQTKVAGSFESGCFEPRVDVEYPNITERRPIPTPPENSMQRRLLGFGWLNGMTNRYRESRGEKGFIDMGAPRCGIKSSFSSSSAAVLPSGARTIASVNHARGREPRRLKRNVTIASSMPMPTRTSPPPSAFAYWNSESTLCKTWSGDLETDMNMGNTTPSKADRSPMTNLGEKRSRENTLPENRSEVKSDNSRYGRTSSVGGLRLKRSFRLDDGRTLSPRLTLAAAISGDVCISHGNGIVEPPFVGGESKPESSWETDLAGRHEFIRNVKPFGGVAQGMGKECERSSQVRRDMQAVTEEMKVECDGKREDMNTPPSRGEVNFETIGSPSHSAVVKSQKLSHKRHSAPEKSRESKRSDIEMNIAQRPLEVPVFIPATSEVPTGTFISTITPSIVVGRTTAVTYSPVPSEPAFLSSTASPLLTDRTPMIFRSSTSDQGHGQRSEPFPLTRISSSPSPRTPSTQLALRTPNVGTPVTPTRGQFTFSSSPSWRLSGATIESVKNAFSGVWSGKRNGRVGAQQSPVPSTTSETVTGRESLEVSTFNGVVILEDDSDGDFLDLRDPFASPRVGKVLMPSGVASGIGSVDSSEDSHEERHRDVLVSSRGIRRKMNTWGKLPTSPRESSISTPRQSEGYATAYSLTGTESRTYFSRIGEVPRHAKSKEYRKERRTRKRIEGGPKTLITKLPILDDVEFDVEEALLTQRLLKRLDSDVHGEVTL